MPAINSGEVETPCGVLRCTLAASKTCDVYFGNFVNANERLTRLEFDAHVKIVAMGLGKEPAEVEESVFAAGVLTLQAPLREYLDLLANGGRKYVAPVANTGGADAGNV